MGKIAWVLALGFAAQVHAGQQSQIEKQTYKGPCWDKALSQLAMDDCASTDLKSADDELNATYQRVLSAMKKHSVDSAPLIAVQRQWIAYRDAQLNAENPLGPGENPNVKYGSMYPMEWGELKALLTWQRTKVLQVMLDDFK
jgi:uncharacterized protein YecT (DUF1311 family)